MSRRQSLDRPGILSPPGPFLTPSPSPSISASPRLQPSPSLSPFPQDVLLVTGNPLTNNSTHEQERKTVTPGRRQSIHQFTNGSPSAGTVVFQPSPSQSPAAATSVIGVTAGGGLNVVAGFPNSIPQNAITTTGNELNTTLVGSNNIQLNKQKGTKRQQLQQQQQQQQQHHQIFSSSSQYSHLPSLTTTTSIASGYGQIHATTINNTPNTFATTTVASSPKFQTKKGITNSTTVLPISQQIQHQNQSQQQQFQQYHTSSPLIADSPSPSPSGTAITSATTKPPTPQPPMQMLQQQFTIASNSSGNGGPQQQTFQLIQGPQGQFIAASTSHQQNQHFQQQHRFNATPTTNIATSTASAVSSKSSKAPQQILPKPQQQQHLSHNQQQQQILDQISLAQQQKPKASNLTPPPASMTSSNNMSQPSLTQISQSGQQQQIILPSGATASLTTSAQQPLLLNQVPVLVQQNTPQGVQLILRPPTPQLAATPSLVIQNRAQPQLQQHQQQVLRILGTNGATMQLAAATPTFIVSSQANLIQQANHLQTIKTQSQSPAITQLSGLHAALSAAAAANNQQQRSQQFATTASTINGHLLSPSVAAQIQNLQLAAAAAANGNGLTAQIQLPNGLTTSGATTLLSQLPGAAQFQQNSQSFNINLNQLSGANIQQIAAAAAAGATFQTPAASHSQNTANNGQQQSQQNSGNNTTANNTATNDLFSNSANAMNNIAQSSPAHCPVAVTPEPIRQPTPVLQSMPAASPQQQTHNPPQIHLSLNAAATIQLQQHQQQQQQAQIQQLQQQIQQTQNQVHQAQQAQQHVHQIHQAQQNQCLPQPQAPLAQQETKKKSKPRKKKPPASSSSANTANKSLTTTANKSLNTNTSTTSVLTPTMTSTSNTLKMVPNAGKDQIDQQQVATNVPPTNQINQTIQDPPVLKSPSSPPPQIQRASNGKLDLGNVMKLCGITDEDDEDFMETSPTEEHTSNQTLSSTQNFTISIPQPNGASETLPYTLSIPGVQSTPNQNANMNTSQEPAANIFIKIDPSETGIGSTSTSMPHPYSITIPRLPSQEEIQKHSQQHLNNLQNECNTAQLKQQQTMLAAQPLNTNITFSMPLHTAMATLPQNNNVPQLVSNCPTSTSPTNKNTIASSTTSAATTTATTSTATIKPRRKPVSKRNNRKDTTNTATSHNSSLSHTTNLNQNVAASSTNVVTSQGNTTTSAISTPLPAPALVPSQIGNIQISQIDNRIGSNQAQMISTPISSLVENKIQIMPIMDKSTNNASIPQLQQTQIVFQPNNSGNNITLASAPVAQGSQLAQQEQPRQMQLVSLPQLSNSSHTSSTSASNQNQQQPQPTIPTPGSQINTTLSSPPNNAQNSVMLPVTQTAMLPGLSGNVSISVGTPNTIAGIIPQLTGSLTLAVSEQCERLILRHDPNQPQDQQSQLILQALLKGALPNVTIINEPTKTEPLKAPVIQQPTLPQPMVTPTNAPSTSQPNTNNATGAVNKVNKKTNKQNTEHAKQSPPTQTLASHAQKQATESNMSGASTANNTNPSLNINQQIPPNVNLTQQRYIALPKIDPNTQQLFSLNPLNNHITPINANHTTASIGPTERLLIAPAGINAQQLAQCLQQGQLHFNDVSPIATQPTLSAQQEQQSMSAATGAASSQHPKQQIVYPMTSQTNTQQGLITATTTTSNTTAVCSLAQPTSATTSTTTTSTTTKQIANVAPIIDQSKAKQDTKQMNNSNNANTGAVPKKKPVRKPKASTTTAADVALMKNASVVKPMPKLDPLSQKPNNNPVQIVQPNTASGKPVVSTSTTSTTTTTTSNVVTIQPFQTQTSTGTKLVGITAPMQQQPQNNLQQSQINRTQTSFSLSFAGGTSTIPTISATSNLNTNPPPINSLNSGLPLSNANSTPNVVGSQPANQPQHTVSRVQTIQLTPQQQQLFKQVQMQIQYLTVKLQHKNLLSSMPLPVDLDPNVVAAFNKPMTDLEINTALQRLFLEQARILSCGKEIPTPEPFITNAANAANNFPVMQANAFASDVKLNSTAIPANIVQPNNHSTSTAIVSTSSTNSVATSNISQQQTQKIHIYPIQHQQQQQAQQQNKQNKQIKQQQQVTVNTNSTINANGSINSLATTTTLVTVASNSGNGKIGKQKPSQPHQQPQINVQQLQSNTNNTLTTTLANPPPTLNPQLPQLSSLTTTPSLPSLPYPSLPPPHMINIANMPAVLQQKHFTQHLQMQQQQLLQQQQKQQKLQNSKPANTFTSYSASLNNLPGFQSGPPPLIFPTSSTTTASNNSVANIVITSSATSTTVSAAPQISAFSQQQQQQQLIPHSSQQLQQTQIQLQTSAMPTTTTFAVSMGNQKTYVPNLTTAMSSVTSSSVQQPIVVSSALSSTSLNTVVTALPQLIATTTTTSSTTITAAASTPMPTSSTLGAAGSMKPLFTLAPTSANCPQANNSIVVQTALFNGGTNVNIVGNPIAQNQTVVKTEEQISPKAKLARLSLFLQQLEVDQQSCLNPDYKSPFQNKEEAVKRLIRFHCMYQTDEDIPSEEEEEFEKSAIRCQDKFRKLSDKFQQLLLQESMLQHRTSEICQMEKLMIEDLQQEIEDSKQLEKDILHYELLQKRQDHQQLQQLDQKDVIKEMENTPLTTTTNPSPCSSIPEIFDQIKNEVKSESLDIKLNLEENSNNENSSNFCNNLQSSSLSLDSIKNEIKGEPSDNSLTSSCGVKSSSSSMDSFDLLKQSPIVNNSFKKQTAEVKELKQEELSNQWKQSIIDSKGSNSYYNHLANITKPANHVFNGVVKKQQPATPAPTAITGTTNNEIKKNEKDTFENFDIESEITPSFIMKKQEPKEPINSPVNVSSVTTMSATTSITSLTTSTASVTKHNTKPTKQVKTSHTFDSNLQGTINNQSTSSQQNQTTSSTTSIHAEIVANSFDFSHHLPVNQAPTKQQEDDWLCLQKELNLINSVGSTITTRNCENSTPQASSEPLAKTLDFLSTASDDLFPNGCINKNMEAPTQTNLVPNNCNTNLVANSCSQQNQQPSLSLTSHEQDQQAADLNEFFSGSEDSEVHKDVETRLEAMFGESPVHLSGNKERSGSPDDIESGLESIFGGTNKSASNNHCVAKEKANWETDFSTNSFMTSNQQHSTNYMNSNNSMPHHIQLGTANNPRWMQNMEAQFPDFLSSSNNGSVVNDCLTSRKRPWNGHIVDDNTEHAQQQQQQQIQVQRDEENPPKKMCDGTLNNGGINDSSASSSSPLSMQQQPQTHHHHHNLVPNDTSHAQELMDAALLSLHDGLGVDSTASDNPTQTNGFQHMMSHHENYASYNNHMDNSQQQQQSQHFMNINQHQNNINAQQQQILNNHMMQMNPHQQQGNIHSHHHAGTGEFDDDITRHVQNAIDSILNLQSSEADSLSFSLDHSMGSLLGDTILNDNQNNGNNQIPCQESSNRRQIVDELGDCLMGSSSNGPTGLPETPLMMATSGATSHSQLMNHTVLHHHNSLQQQQHHGHVIATTHSANAATLNTHHHAPPTGNSDLSVIRAQQQQLNDFNCVVSSLDEAVKSIMTS